MDYDDYCDDRFEWDRAKAFGNRVGHNVTFEEARRVFDDSFALEYEDDSEPYGEQRFVTIGIADGKILVVVHTPRDDRIRIISARKAEPAERRKYHDENRQW